MNGDGPLVRSGFCLSSPSCDPIEVRRFERNLVTWRRTDRRVANLVKWTTKFKQNVKKTDGFIGVLAYVSGTSKARNELPAIPKNMKTKTREAELEAFDEVYSIRSA